MAVAANGVNTVWECYVIGLEPTAVDAKFEATIEMVGGVPKVTWSPDLGVERVYRVLGAKGLVTPVAGDSDGTVWEVVTEETKGDYNFFKVAVEMP